MLPGTFSLKFRTPQGRLPPAFRDHSEKTPQTFSPLAVGVVGKQIRRGGDGVATKRAQRELWGCSEEGSGAEGGRPSRHRGQKLKRRPVRLSCSEIRNPNYRGFKQRTYKERRSL